MKRIIAIGLLVVISSISVACERSSDVVESSSMDKFEYHSSLGKIGSHEADLYVHTDSKCYYIVSEQSISPYIVHGQPYCEVDPYEG